MYEAKQQGRDRVAACWPAPAPCPRPPPAPHGRRRPTSGCPDRLPGARRETGGGRGRRCLLRCRHDRPAPTGPSRTRPRTVPLPLREQADVRDRWLTQRLLDVLPGLMDRAGIDLWLVIGREYNEDPVLPTLLPATWLSARRRTILAAPPQRRRRDRGGGLPLPGRPVRAGLVTRRGAGRAPEQSQWAAVRRIVEQADPPRIGIDVSAAFAHADGLSHTEHELLVDGARARTPSGWCRPRTWRSAGWRPGCPRRSPRCTRINRLVHEVIDEAFSPAVIRVGHDDGAGRRLVDPPALRRPGRRPWFQPTVGLQRAGVPLADERGTAAARRAATTR